LKLGASLELEAGGLGFGRAGPRVDKKKTNTPVWRVRNRWNAFHVAPCRPRRAGL